MNIDQVFHGDPRVVKAQDKRRSCICQSRAQILRQLAGTDNQMLFFRLQQRTANFLERVAARQVGRPMRLRDQCRNERIAPFGKAARNAN